MSSISRPSRSSRRFTGAGAWWAPYAFTLPFVALFLVFLITPILVAVRSSVYSVRSSGLGFAAPSAAVFVGFANYARALGDSDFLASFGRVALFGVVQVPVMMVLAVGLALLFDSPLVKAKPVSYTHLRAHETVLDLVCRL